MKKLILLFALTSFGSQAVEQDKALHFGVSTAIASSTYFITHSWKKSMGVCMGVGLAKELIDERDYGGFDEKDLVADAIGCAFGTVLADTAIKLTAKDDFVGINYSINF